ncbi:glycosyltransferase family 2 protein [Mucilaginibacter sp. E4BP6]|uniref:glycosyltransferase family 2 protein n=1 Tax=Mucilaginibacter sp. E4BP6 TaxID=2723089 RepID=UPI0015CCD56B|nr:glycosyltransferase family 2 protein [Mucilaginibacter sp. E4BP6]NYE67583.1 glycosyltransferase involved in cell wall biosynthesis [Mucilaginibacter sp. E4BP6]
MQDIRVSLITVTYNAESTIERCIRSVIAQNYQNIEYIVIDGASTDSTLQIINRYAQNIKIIISEPDKGMYDALNKGIKLATGDIVGILNADDYFASDDILTDVATVFMHSNTDVLYGNLDFVDVNETIIRKWRTRAYKRGNFDWGWMPAHPTFYCRKSLFNSFGVYSLEHGTAADYELMLRFMHKTEVNAYFLDKVMVKMQCGGMSNKNPVSRIKAWRFDLKAMRKNGIKFPLIALIMKPLRKMGQHF